MEKHRNEKTQENIDMGHVARLISRTFSANEQYFSFTINQPTVLPAMAYQPNE